MQNRRDLYQGYSRIRFIFADTVVSMRLAKNATLEDVAQKLEDVENYFDKHPIAVVIKFPIDLGSSFPT